VTGRPEIKLDMKPGSPASVPTAPEAQQDLHHE
jgi:hypothetical protein